MKFMEKIAKIKEEAKSSRFSKVEAVALATTMMNDPEVEVKSVKKYDKETNEVEMVTTKPVKEMRDLMAKTMKKAGVDKSDADEFMEKHKFEKSEMQFFPDLVNAYVTGYLKTGKSYKLAGDEDLVAELSLHHKEEEVKTHRIPNSETEETVTVRNLDHFEVKSKSSTPRWKKEKVQ